MAGAYALAGGPPSQVEVVLREGTNLAAALSPDGETLAIDLLGSIWLIPDSNNVAHRITDELSDARQPDWAPDGQRIVFQAYRDGNWHIWSIGKDGQGLRQHTFGLFDDREPAWSHDGSRIVFSSDRSGNYDIWELNVASSLTTQITNGPMPDFAPVFSPDSSAIAYVKSQDPGGRILVRQADGTERIVAQVEGEIAGPSFSPDGSHLIFNEIGQGSSRLLLLELGVETSDDEPRTVSSSAEDVFPFRVAWISNDEFLYTADGKIKHQRLLEENLGSLSPQSPKIVEFEARVTFDREPYERRRRDFDSTEPQPVRGIVSPSISPEGDAIAFVALGDLWFLPVTQAAGKADSRNPSSSSGTIPVRLTSDPFIELDPAFSPDGQQLAFVTNRASTLDIWLRDLATGNEKQLTNLPGHELAPSFSPDGSKLAFLDEAGRVMAVEVESGEVATLHTALRYPGRPTWGPDGRTVAVAALTPYSGRFREGRNQFLLISLDGANDRLISPFPHRSIGTRNYDGPIWAPGGRKIAFTASGALWVVDVNPYGEPISPARRLTNELADSPSWTADTASIVYLNNGHLKRVKLADGHIEEIPLNLTWRRHNPVSRRLVHTGYMFDGQTDRLRTNVDIIIDGHRIAAVENHSASLHEEVRQQAREKNEASKTSISDPIFDASSLTVIPGLIEMHTHQSPVTHRIWLAYGITTVREPVTNAYQAVEMREAIAAGVRPGPREFFTGESFDGSRIYYSSSMALDAGAEIDLQLERASLLGYDLIKTYVRLPDVVQKRVVAGAHRYGIPVTSHELYPAMTYGTDGVEHIRGTSRRGYSPKVSQLNRSYQDVIDLLAASGMTLTPTMGIADGSPGAGAFWLAVARDPSLLNDRRFHELFPANLVHQVTQQATDLRQDPRRQNTMVTELIMPYGDTLRRLIARGGKVVAGTDSPIIPPGISLHTEIQNFVEGGLTPFQALQTATVWAAEALGAGEDLGTIEPGKLADLVIIKGDPLSDIRATWNIHTVIKNGKVYPLDQLLH
jgi:Tol biopolymer transport system component/imidazolonepropionase-like amidohydrolase